jgi:hypothetical protein
MTSKANLPDVQVVREHLVVVFAGCKDDPQTIGTYTARRMPIVLRVVSIRWAMRSEHLPRGLPASSWRLACDSASSFALVFYKRFTRPFNHGTNASLLSRIEALSLLCASSDGRNRLSANLGYFDPRWTSSVASECPGSKHKRRNPMTLYSHDFTQQRRS